MIFLDHNSTTPVPDTVRIAMEPFIVKEYANPASVHYPMGRRVKEAVEEARWEVAQLVGASPGQVVFTSGGTESCLASIVGSFLARPKSFVAVSLAVEHDAVLSPLELLQRSPFSAEVSILSVERDGVLDIKKLSDSIGPQTRLVSVMLANNETGTIYPVSEVTALCRAHGITVHSDVIQATGKITVDFAELGVDLLSLSGHKFGAPKGIGALVIREQARWEPLMWGGGQEEGRRGGTPAVSLIVGLGEAARLARTDQQMAKQAHLAHVRDAFEKRLLSVVADSSINGQSTERLPNTSSICLHGVSANELVKNLSEKGVMISAGSACSTTRPEPSHVLRAIGLTTIDCLSTVRISFGPGFSWTR